MTHHQDEFAQSNNITPIAVVRSADDLRELFRQRIASLGITYETADLISGLPSGYSAKLLGPQPIRRFGPVAFESLLGACGIKLVAVEDGEAMARVKARLVARRRRLNTKRASPVDVVRVVNREFLRKIGQWGGFKSGQVRRTAVARKKAISEQNRANVMRRWRPEVIGP
jgi:hypothetical protein